MFLFLQICEKVQSEGFTVVRDPENRMGPYAYKGQEWFSYDDRKMIRQKVRQKSNEELYINEIYIVCPIQTGGLLFLIHMLNAGLTGNIMDAESVIHEHLLYLFHKVQIR